MTRSLRIVVADDEPDTREFFQTVLPSLGHEVLAAAKDGAELMERCQALKPDLVVADVRMPRMDGIQVATALNQEQPIPFVLVSGYQDAAVLERATADNIMAFLMKPVKAGDLMAAVALAQARYEQYREVRAEAADLKQALEDRKVIERAKGVVMRRLGVSEVDAFHKLRKQSSDRNRKLIEVAKKVIEAEEVFRAMEEK